MCWTYAMTWRISGGSSENGGPVFSGAERSKVPNRRRVVDWTRSKADDRDGILTVLLFQGQCADSLVLRMVGISLKR